MLSHDLFLNSLVVKCYFAFLLGSFFCQVAHLVYGLRNCISNTFFLYHQEKTEKTSDIHRSRGSNIMSPSVPIIFCFHSCQYFAHFFFFLSIFSISNTMIKILLLKKRGLVFNRNKTLQLYPNVIWLWLFKWGWYYIKYFLDNILCSKTTRFYAFGTETMANSVAPLVGCRYDLTVLTILS